MTTTPLAFNQAGEGWHLSPRRGVLLKALLALGVALLVGYAVVLLGQGRWPAATVVLVVALCLGSLGFAHDRRALPPRLVVDRTAGGATAGATVGSTGVLLPTHPMRLVIVVALGVLGLLLLAGSGVGFVVAVDRAEAGPAVGGVILLAFALLFVLGAYGGVRARRAPDHGLVLLPDGVVVRTRREPTRLRWDDVAAVRDHWARVRRRGATGPTEQIRNWLTFVPHRERAWPVDPLAVLSGTTDPSVDASTFAMDPLVALAVVRFYRDHPDARGELSSDQALARIDSLARG